jgi:hypothetical protein
MSEESYRANEGLGAFIKDEFMLPFFELMIEHVI